MAKVSIQELCKTYAGSEGAIPVLDHFSLDLEAGRIHAFTGPSGCGKSTLLMLCGGLIRPDRGRILIDGEDMLGFGAEERAVWRGGRIGFVFQRFHLIPYLTVEQNIMASCAVYPVADAAVRCEELLNHLCLEDRRGHSPARLSAGEQQRVALGRALLGRPSVLVADEPTGNLDEENSTLLLGLLRSFAEGGGLVIMATHDRALAQKADQAYRYQKGDFKLY